MAFRPDYVRGLILLLAGFSAAPAGAVDITRDFTGTFGIAPNVGGANTPGAALVFFEAAANDNAAAPLTGADVTATLLDTRCRVRQLNCDFSAGVAAVNALSPLSGISYDFSGSSGTNLARLNFNSSSAGNNDQHTSSQFRAFELQLVTFGVPGLPAGAPLDMDLTYSIAAQVNDNSDLGTASGSAAYELSAFAQAGIFDSTTYDGSNPDTSVFFPFEGVARLDLSIDGTNDDFGFIEDAKAATKRIRVKANTLYIVFLDSRLFLETFGNMDGLSLSAEIFSDPTFSINPAFAAANPTIAQTLTIERATAAPVPPICSTEPALGCQVAGEASLAIVETKPGREKVNARFRKFIAATGLMDLGDPAAGATRYDLCLYDDANQSIGEFSVDRARQRCGPKRKKCWKAVGNRGYVYEDPYGASSGVKKIAAKRGSAGKGKLDLEARNKANKGQTAMPSGLAGALQGATSALMQIVTSDGLCFEALLDTVNKNNGVKFKAKTGVGE